MLPQRQELHDLCEVERRVAHDRRDDALATQVNDAPEEAEQAGGDRRVVALLVVAEAEEDAVDGHPGGALWDAPGRWRTTWVDIVRAAPMMISGVGPRIPRALGGLGQMEKSHPREPHWYLAILGTDPPQQGKGVGGALMAPVLARCDAERTGAYLESSKPDNVPYYERFGFRVTGQIDLPDGPTMWPMWRDPQ